MKIFSLTGLCVLSVIFLTACGGSDTEKPAPEPVKKAEIDIRSNPDYQKGLALIAQSDCLTCHKINEKLVGPAYVDVANKYSATPENITKLAHTVINGVEAGKGVWGTMPMTPHPQLSQTDAEQMVKYVLLLRKS